jgi:DNA-directed RNA polymerase specialized sigma24 family protein
MRDVHGTIDAVWRIESARLIAGLARVVGDVGFAEDVAQDALEAALRQWPASGVPDNPGAWLMAVGRRRAIDLLRRKASLARKSEEIGREIEIERRIARAEHEADDADDVGDDLLRLVFIACHPVLSLTARVALTLRLLGGLTTGGLGWTDWGRKNAIGGLSRDFYRRVGRHYGLEEEFTFEPHVATAVYDQLLKIISEWKAKILENGADKQ